jgi:hypothetical protein
MAEEIRHPDGRIEHPSVHYEHSDASFGWVVIVVLVAAVVGLAILIGVGIFHARAANTLAEARKSRFPLAATPSLTLPPAPRLEQLERMADLPSARALQKTKLEKLHRFGPTDDKGYIHIPIEKAMSLLADKLPARGDQPADSHDNGLADGGASNSGRLFKKSSP